MKSKLFARIEKLFDVGTLAEARVLVAGCGSGGGMVALQLAMSGLAEFVLVDDDVLEPENVKSGRSKRCPAGPESRFENRKTR